MNHMNEITQLLDNIIVCGESMAKIGKLLKEFLPEFVDAIPQKTKAEKMIEVEALPDTTPATPPAEEKKEPTYSFTDVRKAFSAKSHEGYTDQVKALITKYGADRLSDVKESDYPALMKDLEVIG